MPNVPPRPPRAPLSRNAPTVPVEDPTLLDDALDAAEAIEVVARRWSDQDPTTESRPELHQVFDVLVAASGALVRAHGCDPNEDEPTVAELRHRLQRPARSDRDELGEFRRLVASLFDGTAELSVRRLAVVDDSGERITLDVNPAGDRGAEVSVASRDVGDIHAESRAVLSSLGEGGSAVFVTGGGNVRAMMDTLAEPGRWISRVESGLS